MKFLTAAAVALPLLFTGCTAMTVSNPHPLPSLLADGQAVFGVFARPGNLEQAAGYGQNRAIDFVFYSLERPPFDLEAMGGYREAIQPAHPFALRIPPVHLDPEDARQKAQRALDAGVDVIVYPHVTSAEEAAAAVAATGPDCYPANPSGRLLNYLIVEDVAGVEQADAIANTPGVSVLFAGPGDLRRAYDGDMDAVEAAIQRILRAALDAGVPAGITVQPDDVEERIQQGFSVFIVYDEEAIPLGRAASGRDNP